VKTSLAVLANFGGETGSTEVVKHWLRTEIVASRK